MTPKVPFKLLRGMGDMLKKKYDEDPNAYWEGRHIYGVEIEPEHGIVRVHVQAPLFVQMVREHANGEAELDLKDYTWYHGSCKMHGIILLCCMDASDLRELLKDVELPEGTDHEALKYESVENLLNMYQQFTGWNLKQQEVKKCG